MNADSGFFTLGVATDAYHLPHAKLGLPVILLIRRVLCCAFAQLREQRFNLARAVEDEITAALLSVIENKLRQDGSVAGFNKQTYERVVRQTETANYDGTKLGTAPDLCFRLRCDDLERQTALSEYDGLFVECKPVDSTHPAGSRYCDDGLIRFVRGDYAWAMQEGMMLAYAREERTIAGHLIPAMEKADRRSSLATNQMPSQCHESGAVAVFRAEAVFVSKHTRNFQWPDGKGRACDITVYHLWHESGS